MEPLEILNSYMGCGKIDAKYNFFAIEENENDKVKKERLLNNYKTRGCHSSESRGYPLGHPEEKPDY